MDRAEAGDGRRTASVWVSVTGLRLHSPLQAPRFWWHAVRAMAAARAAEGILLAEARTIEGVHHTLTVWRDAGAMRRFLVSPAHARAMAAFPGLGTGETVGYAADAVPDWPAALAAWRARAT